MWWHNDWDWASIETTYFPSGIVAGVAIILLYNRYLQMQNCLARGFLVYNNVYLITK